MAKPYNITITNGEGTAQVINGEYQVTANAVGYLNSSIDPTSLTINNETDTYSLTIAASGSLIIHVSDDGTETGNPIVGATFYRTDSSGNNVGNPFTTDNEGKTTITYLPFASENSPTVYYKQTISDGNHNFDNTVKEIILTEEETPIEIENSNPLTKTFILKDANYTDLNIQTATITLN